MALIQSFCLKILQDPDGQISARSPVTLALTIPTVMPTEGLGYWAVQAL